MLHTKSQGHWPSGSGEEDLRVFTIYGRGSHLGHVNKLSAGSLHMKFEINWLSGFRENYVLIY